MDGIMTMKELMEMDFSPGSPYDREEQARGAVLMAAFTEASTVEGTKLVAYATSWCRTHDASGIRTDSDWCESALPEEVPKCDMHIAAVVLHG